MAYFNTKERKYEPRPIPPIPPYVPPVPPVPPEAGGGSDPDVPRPGHSGDASITLYVNSSDNNVVNKSLSTVTTINNIAWKQDTSVLNPIVILETNQNINNCNYAYIPQFARYYYITDIALLKAGRYSITLKVDVLKTYDSQIRALKGVVRRNESLFNKYLADDTQKVLQYTEKSTLQFNNPFNKDGQFLLTVSGGN